MLVLSRKQGESIIIGRNIELVVTKTKGDRVKLAITAPANVSIRRGELPAAISPRRLPRSPMVPVPASASKHERQA